MKFGAGEKKHRNKIIIFTLISLGVHILVLFFAPVQFAEKKEDDTLYVELDPALISPTDPKLQKQIVNTENSDNKTLSKDAKYLSDKTQSVEQETKARQVDTFQKGGASATKTAPALSLKNLAPQKNITAQTPRTDSQENEIGDLQKEQNFSQPQQPPQAAGGNIAGSANNDYLKDIKEGDKTILSTKEFVYFGYYHRIRQRLERSWKNKLQNTLEGYMVSGRQLASERSYVTKLVVVLDRHGRITAVKLLGDSGARDLDRAAVDAFNQAGPFPDPPSGLIDENGQIKISWDFVLQT